MKKPFRIDPHTGAEDQRNKNTSNEERYYMREYAPGDRFRDINWKSSDRIDTLITRISPDNQEKVSRIEVYFRNFGPSGGGAKNQASLKDLWLFDRAKARLTQFLRAVNDEQNRYIFCIHTAQKNWEITDQDELELFLEELGSLSFAPPRNEPPFSLGSEKNAAPGGVYVFSTSCDPGLPGFLLSCQPRPVFLFFVRSGAPKIKADTVERLYVRDFLTQGFILAPGLLVSGSAQEVNPPGLAGGTIEIDYAEVRL